MVILALAMFVALFGFGEDILGYRDGSGMVRVGLLAAFTFGIICGLKLGR